MVVRDAFLADSAVLEPRARTYIDQQLSPHSRRAYEQDLRRWAAFRDQRPDLAGYDLVVAFRDHLAETLAPASAGRAFSTVRSYHRWLVQLGEASSNPFEAIKGPRRTKNETPKVPSNDDVEALVAAARERPLWSAVVALLLNGLRAMEVGRLRKADISWFEGKGRSGYFMRVLGKGDKERLMPLTTESLNALNDFWRSTDRESEYAVFDAYGAPLSNKAVAHIVDDAARKAKIEGMHPHALRHHYATRLYNAGVNILAVRDLLGHASVATTQVYVTLDMSDLFEAAAKDPREATGEVRLRAVS